MAAMAAQMGVVAMGEATMFGYDLTADEQALWEDEGPDGENFRRELRERLDEDAGAGTHIEVYADSYTADAWTALTKVW